MLYTQIHDETRKSKSKRIVQGEIKGETVRLDLPGPSDPNGPDGPPHPCALIGGAQLNPSWWAPVAPRYKKEVGASGTRHEVHRPPPPHPQSTLADLSQAWLRREAPPAITLDAPASTPSSRTRPHRRPPRPCTPTAGPPRAPRAAPPWRARRHPLLPKGTKVLPCSSLSLSISLSVSRLSKPKGVFLI
jgi:hypothetical protein